MILAYITCKNKVEAKKIGSSLVKRRMATCCNIFPVESIYWRQGKIVNDKEVVLIAKTLKRNFKKVEKEVINLHSYSTPCILEIPTGRVNSKYLNWLKKEII
jgi:periplasmic divalent cation tolerance protein